MLCSDTASIIIFRVVAKHYKFHIWWTVIYGGMNIWTIEKSCKERARENIVQTL